MTAGMGMDAEIIGQMRDERPHIADFRQQSPSANLLMVMPMPMTDVALEMVEIVDDVLKFRSRGVVVSRVGEFVQSLHAWEKFVVHFGEGNVKSVVSPVIRMHILIGLPHGFHQPVRHVVNVSMRAEGDAIRMSFMKAVIIPVAVVVVCMVILRVENDQSMIIVVSDDMRSVGRYAVIMRRMNPAVVMMVVIMIVIVMRLGHCHGRAQQCERSHDRQTHP